MLGKKMTTNLLHYDYFKSHLEVRELICQKKKVDNQLMMGRLQMKCIRTRQQWDLETQLPSLLTINFYRKWSIHY